MIFGCAEHDFWAILRIWNFRQHFGFSNSKQVLDRTIHNFYNVDLHMTVRSIIHSYNWHYMDQDWELIIPILEILEIEVFNILYNPGNIGKGTFSLSSYPGNIGNLVFPFSGHPGNIENFIFLDFEDFSKKDAHRNFTQNPPINEPRSLIWDRFRAKI